VKLYVCWTTSQGPLPKALHAHACHVAYQALVEAGYRPEVVKTHGLGPLPDFLNPGRKRVRELTGQQWVPVLELDDGTVIRESEQIAAWALANPAARNAA
jgi:glutathione S-transferase